MTLRDVVLFVNTRRTTLEAHAPFYAAARLGLDVVLLADKPILITPGLAEVVLIDTYDHQATLDAAREIARRRHVVGITTWGDRDVEAVAHIAEQLGLAGHPPAAAAAARNKYTARTLLQKTAPHLVPPFRQVRSAPELASAAEHVGFPAILKPAGASSSKGIFQVADTAQLGAAFDRLMSYTKAAVDPIFRFYPNELIMEGLVEGSEHSLQGIVVNGKVVRSGVTDKWVTTPFCLEYLQFYPSQLSATVLQLAQTAANDAVTALGLERGAIAMDFRYLPDGSVKILELNGRAGGNFITSHLIPLSQGYDFLGAAIAVLSRTDEPCPMLDAHSIAGSIQVITKKTGRFMGFRNLEGAMSVPGIEHFTYEAPPGSIVRQPPDDFVTSIVATFIGRAPDHSTLSQLLHEAAELCQPVVGGE